jgi:tetratricopeptide (TPR) repeat protein
MLVAQIEGGGLRGNWRVRTEDLEDPGRQEPLPHAEEVARMTEQLAYRIFTELVSIGSRKWEAVRSYTEGLAAYRGTKLSQRDRDIKLFETERAFIQALAEDNKFSQCHYNLGVVYRDLRQLDSAAAAFRRALQEDPNNHDAYYALAENSWKQGNLEQQKQAERYEDAIRLCDQAVCLRAADTRMAPERFRSAQTKRTAADTRDWTQEHRAPESLAGNTSDSRDSYGVGVASSVSIGAEE